METAISACHVIPARELASLAHACGTLKNISKSQMLVRPHTSSSSCMRPQLALQFYVSFYVAHQKVECTFAPSNCLRCCDMNDPIRTVVYLSCILISDGIFL